jgi:rsbT co-antagonist protein RsbR
MGKDAHVGSDQARERGKMVPRPVSADLDLREMEVDLPPEEIRRRKQWLEFDEGDEARLEQLNELAAEYADEVIEDLYEHFLAFPETRRFFEDPDVLDYVKAMQRAYFLRLTQGGYNQDYISERLKIGAVHEQIGLDVKWYLGAYNRYLRAVGQRIFRAYPGDPSAALEAFYSLKKLVFLDIGLAIDTYVYQRERTIREQQEAIRELSTPVLRVREGLLILPIIGLIDAQRARQLTEQLLMSIRANRGRVVVVDVTGVPTVDTQVANHLVQTVEASRLMGARAIISGLTAEVAQTLVTLGVDLTKLNTVGDLQGGIEEAERLLGYEIAGAGDGNARTAFAVGEL